MEIFSEVDELYFGTKPFICKLPIKIINDLGKARPRSTLCRYTCLQSTHSWLLWGYFLPELNRLQITFQHRQHMEAL